jgi:hypothetical protein
VGPDNKPIYGKCKDINEMWVPLMEKAYAKVRNHSNVEYNIAQLHGCYEVLQSGSIAAAMTDLTGESTDNM